MKNTLKSFLDINDYRSIESAHRIQKNLYGVFKPPSLKQLISLRHLLIRTGYLSEVHSEELLGLSKIECDLLLKKLNSIYISQRRNNSRNEEEPIAEVSREFKCVNQP